MIRFHQMTVVLLALTVFSSTAVADNPFDKIGRGRLLRKVRDELFGKPDPPKQNTKKTNDPRQQPTPADRAGRAKSPTPARRTSSRMPTGSRQPTSAKPNNRAAEPALTKQQIQDRQRTARKFGMIVQGDQNNRFFVVKVDPQGNAAKAGLRRGDQLTQIGGSKLESIEQFYQIANVLGEGDGIEFEVSRKGKKNTVMVHYGQPNEPADKDDVVLSEPLASTASAENDRYRSSKNTNPKFRSVLERGGSLFRSTSKK
jgi:membrane-associated protease RseP (regulator of RpoE activity)